MLSKEEKKAIEELKSLSPSEGAIKTILNLITKLQKENEELKYHIHYKICKNCGEEYKSKRNDSKYCSKCARTVNNKNWYKNLTEKQKAKRREQAKFYMRKIRKEKKQND